ncbi:HAD family hydrolase [Halorubellus sp. JP-L1]|uniref:HAD family hydrolase n=1 Tax=Halorubellus sp. JP-L1 TaxID=2715753 RepID=UPI00140E89C0|nr:HAD family hydrolase [Halorubellus sp. JP-L1]NHN40577.1 HAD family hydrolase [Halorubellus sp. JP-L1]
MSTEAVLFDLDGTLYPYPECNRAGKRAAWRTAHELGYDFDREAFETLYQEGRRATKRELAGTASAHERFLYFKHAIQIHAETHRSEHALELGEAYWDAYVHEMELYDDVERVFRDLHDADVAVAIVTNLTTRIQLKKIHHLGIEPHVDLLLTSEETGREKPSSVMFTYPLAQLDCRPSDAAFVGDDPASDVEGGNAVGLETVLLDPGREYDALAGQQRPDHHIHDFGDVTDVVL